MLLNCSKIHRNVWTRDG